ncbi:MAG: methionyl-tRNA formyltransferase [bacterium]
MRIVFMGSGAFACPIVRAIHGASAGKLVGVVTQPDRPKGRNRQVAACPVKEIVAGTGVKILTPEKIGAAVDELRALAPDLIVVADYGQYIPSSVLAIPPKRAINVHPSLLPKYRGAAPIQWAIANGDTKTGVTVQYVAKKMDSGDVLLQQEFDIGADDTAETLEARLAEAGAELVLRAIEEIETGSVHATPQDEAHATYARKLIKDDGRIDWSLPARTIRDRVRGFQPWPGSFCAAQKLKVLAARAEDGSGSPGTILDIGADGPLVAAGDGALRLIAVHPEGKKSMSGADFVRGYRVNVGDRFG